MTQENIEEFKEKLINNWPSTIVARQEVEKFSGGVISHRYLSKLDSQKKGPLPRYKIGRKIAYPKIALANWIAGRTIIHEI